MTDFRLNPRLDPAQLATTYARDGRVRIEGLLEEDAVAELRAHLDSHDQWWHLICTADGIEEIDRRTRARMSAKRLSALESEVHLAARRGFTYRYEALRVPDEEEDLETGDDPLTAFARLMSSEPMLAMLRQVTGCTGLSFTDGQATAYGHGDFLTCHDDDVAGKNRLAAYVFGMTPGWRPEWGGLLLFHADDDRSVTGHVPLYNCLDLFSVPQRHSVSSVTPAAPHRRFAVTGWLRSGTDED